MKGLGTRIGSKDDRKKVKVSLLLYDKSRRHQHHDDTDYVVVVVVVVAFFYLFQRYQSTKQQSVTLKIIIQVSQEMRIYQDVQTKR
jgi:hypothetical protein